MRLKGDTLIMKVLLKQEWKVHSKPWRGLLMLENLRKEFYMIRAVKIYDKVNNKSWIYECRNNTVCRTEYTEYRKKLAQQD